MAEIIAFDLNKTLIRENSWYDLNLAMGISPEEDEALYRLGPEGSGEITYLEWIGRLARLMMERGQANRQNIENVLLKYTYLEGAQETVTTLKKRPNTLVGLITGALSPVAEQVASELNLDFMYCNAHMRFNAQDMLESIELGGEDFAFKVDAVAELKRTHPGVDTIYYVADGDTDEAVFEVTNGILVTPDPATHEIWKQQALQAGDMFSLHRAAQVAWKIAGNIRDVPDILSTT